MALGELAEFEGLNPSMLSRVVGKLEPMGLIRRYADPADGRVAHVAITPAGTRPCRPGSSRRGPRCSPPMSPRCEPDLQQTLLIDVVPALEALAEHLGPSPCRCARFPRPVPGRRPLPARKGRSRRQRLGCLLPTPHSSGESLWRA